jgi:Mn2+/Fe2+ NRAMP family transporter
MPSRPPKSRLLRLLGPGLITGASDDDPSGIATYSQAGAQYGVNMLWTMVLTYPLMTAIAARGVKTSRFHTGMRSQLTGQM